MTCQAENLVKAAEDSVRTLMLSTPLGGALVFPFWEAPESIQALSTNGGDEDWVAIIPPGYPTPYWVESDGFSCCDLERFDFVCGATVYIGSHA